TPRPTVADFMAKPMFAYDFEQLRRATSKPRQKELDFP
ncbi:MAG: hypothetical protein ACI9G1_004309, partial [Pirellulaceae bacterium]